LGFLSLKAQAGDVIDSENSGWSLKAALEAAYRLGTAGSGNFQN
jgi:hypothetical protein